MGELPDIFGGQNQFAQNPFMQQSSDVVPLDLQTELKRISLAQKPPAQNGQQAQGFNPMSLLGLLGGGLGGLGNLGLSPSDSNNPNNIGVGTVSGGLSAGSGALGYAAWPFAIAPLVASLYNNPAVRRLMGRISDSPGTNLSIRTDPTGLIERIANMQGRGHGEAQNITSIWG